MGASLAFDAGLERFQRTDYILLSYHIHIPLPDPMTNPSSLARQSFYGVNSTPTYYVDGERDGGGGGADQAKSIFDRKVDPTVTSRLETAPQARIDLRAARVGSTVKVKTKVSKLTNASEKLKLQLALVEEQVRYSGENGMRFHEMVVRSLAAVPPIPAVKPATQAATDKAADAKSAGDAKPVAEKKPAVPSTGFQLKPGKGGSFEYTFDLNKVVADAKAHLEDFETNTRKGEYSFREKKHAITGSLAVVAFVQDEATKKILQAVYVTASSPRTTN